MALGCCSVLERGDVLLSMDRLFGYEGMDGGLRGGGEFFPWFPWFPWDRVGDEWGVCNPGVVTRLLLMMMVFVVVIILSGYVRPQLYNMEYLISRMLHGLGRSKA